MRLALVTVYLLSLACNRDEPPAVSPREAVAVDTASARSNEADPPAKSGASVLSDPADYVGKYVLVPHGAKLHIEPREGAGSAKLYLLDTPPNKVMATRTMKVVGHAGAFIAVRPATEDKRCTPAMPGLASFDVKLWVRPGELAPVLRVRTEARGADGEVAKLWPGVPVHSDATGATVDVGDLELGVLLDAAKVGTAFVPEPLPAIADSAVALQDGPAVTWKNQALNEKVLLGARKGNYPAASLGQAVASGKRAVTVWARCAELVGSVDASRPHTRRQAAAHPPMPGLLASMKEHGSTVYEVSTGTEAFWRDGAKAGVVAKVHQFGRAPGTHKGRQCFQVALVEETMSMVKKAPPKDSQFELCFERSAVRKRAFTHPLFKAGKPPDAEMTVKGGLTGNEVGTMGEFSKCNHLMLSWPCDEDGEIQEELEAAQERYPECKDWFASHTHEFSMRCEPNIGIGKNPY